MVRRPPRALDLLVCMVCAVLLTGCSATVQDARPAPTSGGGPLIDGLSVTASSDDGSARAASLASEQETGQAATGGPTVWRAAATDQAPWVQLAWATPRKIASVQVAGPAETAQDPQQATAAALYGDLRFSDGSTVAVAGIAAGGALPTTVAFPARSTTSVRLELHRQIAEAAVGLRALTAYAEGTTPPRPAAASGSPSYTVTPPAAACSDSQAGSGNSTSATAAALVCPAPGASVTDRADIVVSAAPGAEVTGTVSLVGATPTASAVADGSGRARLQFDTTAVPRGPFVVVVRVVGGSADQVPLYVQLFHASGAVQAAGVGDSAPAGMTLQYADDFDGPLSVTVDGWGAQYAAVKPEPWGGSQFGESVFADPAWGAGTLATLPGGFLRIRNQPIGKYSEHQTWGQQHISGILSSQRFGGSGFSAQYGYFEARILGAPGPGAWPAFWMMNSASGVGRPQSSTGEVDAVELYGHAPRNACHATHAWGASKDSDGLTECLDLDGGGDWAAQWHTYGVQVRSGGADFFVDGVKVSSLSQLSNTDEPFFFMLDLATGGGWPVDLSATQQTTDMYVDWVRVYT